VNLAEVIEALRTLHPDEVLEYGITDQPFASEFAKTLREEANAVVQGRKEDNGSRLFIAMSQSVMENYLTTYEVLDTSINKEYYPNWIGRILVDPPPKPLGAMAVMQERYKRPNYFGPWPQFDDEGYIIGEEVGSDAWMQATERRHKKESWNLAQELWEKAKSGADVGLTSPTDQAPTIDEVNLAEVMNALRTIRPNEVLEYGHPDKSFAFEFAQVLREKVNAAVQVRQEGDGFRIYVAMSGRVLRRYMGSK
jgi:TusA-related sulfurtransferase